ncbi:Protein of unknown function [Allopseudospirillum japonicum]|uniref:DUF1302 domain-containing protein n=1 Tax=Allopseudospirillum japonicum TaxID=64971 RepID=A0A1H6SGN2_9GAMM|nr:DUF1302 domain-containing protein [Allopseudospirillum japonicum]SEI67118.1 Protein of unknown function [Allopseudospirillum japonicum]
MSLHQSKLSAFSLALLAAQGGQAFAGDFQLGTWDAQLNSQISVGASWRAGDRNSDYLGAGTLQQGSLLAPAQVNPLLAGQQTNNTDDGNQNYDTGELFSLVIKGSHELNLSREMTGFKFGVRYWYDAALDHLDRESAYGQMNTWQYARSFDEAKGGVELLDAYLWHELDIADQPAQVKLGRHVLNWGESTFIQGGINSINPVDVPALRKPGAELKEGLLPVAMLSASLSLNDAWSLEGFYQLKWEQTRPDACGTYFSNNDFAAEGCGPVYFGGSRYTEMANEVGIAELAIENSLVQKNTGYSLAQIQTLAATQPDHPDLPLLLGAAQQVQALVGQGVSLVAPRGPDQKPSDAGQYGVALRWYAEALNHGTEFGFYHLNYHSRLPYVNGVLGTNTPNSQGQPNAQDPSAGTQSQYQIAYPEDIKVYGMSFATSLPTGTAWSGEVSYRPDQPIQINANDILVRAAPYLVSNPSAGPNASLWYSLPEEVRAFASGTQVEGYRRLPVTQLQTTLIHDVNRVLAADNLRLVGEVGFTWVGDLPDQSQIRFGRSSIYGSYGSEGYVTDFSWGYRLRATLEYPNQWVSGLTIKPTLAWSHDVQGYGPEPGAQFYEGRKIIGLSLAAEYLNTYQASLSYTEYLKTDYWDLDDRDFIAISLGMSY